MRFSNFFAPTSKDNPAIAQIVSHRLMLRSGMISQTAAGIYCWLPLAVRVIKKITKIICEEQDRIGANQVFFTTIQPADLWIESGRYDDYGKEMLRLGLKYAFEIYGAQKATLGVFENNPSAYFCYKAAGFRDVTAESQETYTVMGEEWKCLELMTEEG